MKELTMKEKIDKVLDKRDEMESLRSEFAPFMESTYSSQLVCLPSREKVDLFASEFDKIAEMKARDDKELPYSYEFSYRGVCFYFLIEK